MSEKGVTLYFMRHGETYLNALERMQGWSDAPLTPKGRIDVLRSGYGLKDVKFKAIYTSDLRRTVETAQLALKYNQYINENIKIHMMREFREVFFGSFEGEVGREAWKKVRELGYNEREFDKTSKHIVMDQLNAFKAADPKGWAEDFNEFWTRVERGLVKLISEHRESDENILVVSHGMTIRNIMHELIPDFELDTPIKNAAITVVEYRNGKFHLKALNQIKHFVDVELVNDDSFEEIPFENWHIEVE
ncbi:histidine phosphatase family protein [Atopobacter phocae]|uniref:histidine phosphatase family protein n=1 Tax=Atopobacter phocae TaxID=136492 RepID=UPI00046F4DBB|nr:histidine phosphatase family protein [Atopobacter phocae]